MAEQSRNRDHRRREEVWGGYNELNSLYARGTCSGHILMKLTRKQNAQKRDLLVSPSKFIDIATATTAIAGIIKRD